MKQTTHGCSSHAGPWYALGIILAAAQLATAGDEPRRASAEVPGVVISYSPAASGRFIGSPGLAIWTNGDYLASHDLFGPKSGEHERATSWVFRSSDRGASWRKVATVDGAFWSSLFVHRGAAYLMGTDKHHGRIVIRRSTDGGNTWTDPRDASSGLLTAVGEYHTAPVPVLEHEGRLWRAFEDAGGGTRWGERYRAMMMSIPTGADLLETTNWVFSNWLPSERAWNGGDMAAWLEGNAVLGPEGTILNILRVDTARLPEIAAMVHVSPDGQRASFDPATGFVPFPGGSKKFTIRYDKQSGRYWSLPTVVGTNVAKIGRPASVRNTLALSSSKDLRQWTVHRILHQHPDVTKHGFQYVDWLFEGEDIIAACRTAYDDSEGGARNFHDANYLTFHRIRNFRAAEREALNMDRPRPSETRVSGEGWTLTGTGFETGTLTNGAKAFLNRDYVLQNVPSRFQGWNFTCLGGGEPADLVLRANRELELHMATATSQKSLNLTDWSATGSSFQYTDAAKTELQIYMRRVSAGQEVRLPQGNWTGSLLLWPGERKAE